MISASVMVAPSFPVTAKVVFLYTIGESFTSISPLADGRIVCVYLSYPSAVTVSVYSEPSTSV